MADQDKQQLGNESGKKGKAIPEQVPGFGHFQGMIKEVLPDHDIVEATHDEKVLQGVLLPSGGSSKNQKELLMPMNGKSAFITPTKETFSDQDLVDVGLSEDAEEIDAPNAPKRVSNSRLCKRKLAKVSVALFASADDEARLKGFRSPE